MTTHGFEQHPAGGHPTVDRNSVAERSTSARLVPEFSGRAGEYFGIWLVNVLLSVVTLGIYSAWAKVRTQQYFYANTRLAGATFDYLANPLAILKGRLITLALVATLGLSARFFPLLSPLLALGLALAWPALIVLSLRFRARNSAWRGLRFRFTGEIADAYGPFLGWRILTTFTMTLVYPLMARRQHRYVVEGHAFGQRGFRFHGTTEQYYKPYAIALAFSILGLIGFFVVADAIMPTPGTDPAAQAPPPLAILAPLAVLYPGMFVILIMMSIRYHNLFWNNTKLAEHGFESTLRVRDMLWLYFSNALAVAFTLGLATPWAMVRLARYRAAHFALMPAGSLDEFVAGPDDDHGATGAELVDALDSGIDLEFGI